MLNKTIFSISIKRENRKIIAWKVEIFGWYVPGSNWSEPKAKETYSAIIISLFNIVGCRKVKIDDGIREAIKKQFTIPLLSAVLGDKVTIEKEISKPRTVNRLGVMYQVTECARREGYQLVMPFFYSTSVRVWKVACLSDESVKIYKETFALSDWVNRTPTGHEVIKEAIELSKLFDLTLEELL